MHFFLFSLTNSIIYSKNAAVFRVGATDKAVNIQKTFPNELLSFYCLTYQGVFGFCLGLFFFLVSKLENDLFLPEESLQCSQILLLVYHDSELLFTVPITLY